MKQKNIISLSRNPNKNNIYLVINPLKRKLRKLIIQNSFSLGNSSIFIYRRSLFVISDNIGDIYKFFIFLHYLDSNIFFVQKMKKKQIINRIGLFKTDISEEKILLQEEIKPRIFKKLGRRYKAEDLYYNLSDYAETFISSSTSRKNLFRNYFPLKNVLPNKNILISDFFFNILMHYFRNYRSLINTSVLIFNSKNFFFLCLIYNYIVLNFRINYFFLQSCQLFIK